MYIDRIFVFFNLLLNHQRRRSKAWGDRRRRPTQRRRKRFFVPSLTIEFMLAYKIDFRLGLAMHVYFIDCYIIVDYMHVLYNCLLYSIKSFWKLKENTELSFM